MKVTCEIEDILANWDKVRYAFQNAAHLTPKENLQEMIYNTLCEILCGFRKVWILHDDAKIKAVVGAFVQKLGGDSFPSVFAGPIYGYSPMTVEEKQMLMDGINDFAKQQKCKIIYTYSFNPKVWVVTEQVGMKFVAKLFIKEVR